MLIYEIYMNIIGIMNIYSMVNQWKVSWDDEIPNCFWKVIKFMFQSTNQMLDCWRGINLLTVEFLIAPPWLCRKWG